MNQFGSAKGWPPFDQFCANFADQILVTFFSANLANNSSKLGDPNVVHFFDDFWHQNLDQFSNTFFDVFWDHF